MTQQPAGVPRLLAVASHPIQYFAPVYRALHQRGLVTLRVLYCREFGTVPRYDKQFDRTIQWDTDMLDGYDSQFLSNWSPITDTFRPLHALNPGVIRHVAASADAVWINGFWYPTNILAIATARARGIPVLFRSELRPNRLRGGRRAKARAALYATCLSSVNRVLYIGAQNQAAYASLGVPPERMTFCPYTVEMGRFDVPEAERRSRRDRVRRELGIAREEKVVLFLGKLTRRKRPLDLVALDRSEQARNVVLLWVGSGELEQETRRQCDGLTRCRGLLAGFVNQTGLPDYLWAADVFVFPAVDEPWGLTLNEAMAAGVPAVVSDDVGAADDLCVDGVTGFRFPAGNTDVMTARILQILGDDRLRQDMAAASLRLIKEWTPEATARGVEDAVLDALAIAPGDRQIKKPCQSEV